VEKFAIDNARGAMRQKAPSRPSQEKAPKGAIGAMGHAFKILRLADVVDLLSRAQDELASTGYDGWGRELGELVEAIDLEIGWLQTTSPSDT
jgi:hypothetical protein